MRSSRQTSGITALLVALGMLMAPWASAQEQTAEEVLEKTTDEVLSVIDEAADYVRNDPDRYYRRVNEVLDDVVDFRGFARGVMGDYASSERYRSLDQEGREQLREQLARFSDVMREGLVRTYGKGLLAFAGSRIEMPDPEAADDATRVAVQQLIHSNGKSPYEVVYHMGRDGDGLWKLRNMVIEDVNLGKIYRSQFESAARKHDGDLDQVIANWSAVELDDA